MGTAISFFVRQSLYVKVSAINSANITIGRKIDISHTLDTAIGTEKNNKNVATSAANPNDLTLLNFIFLQTIYVITKAISGQMTTTAIKNDNNFNLSHRSFLLLILSSITFQVSVVVALPLQQHLK